MICLLKSHFDFMVGNFFSEMLQAIMYTALVLNPTLMPLKYLVPGIMNGKDNMASEIAVQSFSICFSREESLMLISISHIASNVICSQNSQSQQTLTAAHSIVLSSTR